MGTLFLTVTLFLLITDLDACIQIEGDELYSVNCTGKYTCVVEAKKIIQECGRTYSLAKCGPMEIRANDCCEILLRAKCVDGSTPVQLQVMVLWVLLFSAVSGLLLSMAFILGLRRLKSKGAEVVLTPKSAIVRDSEGTLMVKFRSILIMSLALRNNVQGLTCVSPGSSAISNHSSTFTFSLVPGSSACFAEGVLTHKVAESNAELTKLYVTAAWNHKVISGLACGEGGCGSASQCSSWGEDGKIIENNDTMSQYKKSCTPNLRPWTSCFYSWGCWMLIREISWKKEDLWDVHAVGPSRNQDNYEVSGLSECSITTLEKHDSAIKGTFLLTRGSQARLCRSASEEGFPEAGKIGDLQLVDGKAIFDYRAFKCDVSTAYSSGNCEVEEPGTSLSRSRCLTLPASLSDGTVFYDNGSLIFSSAVSREFTLTCGKPVQNHVSDHDCYSLQIASHGIRSELDFMYVSFKGFSHNLNSTFRIDGSCHMEKIEVPCDGKEHIVKSYTYPVVDCFPSFAHYIDETTGPAAPSWIWDHEDHAIFGPSGSIKGWSLYLIGVAGLIILAKLLS